MHRLLITAYALFLVVVTNTSASRKQPVFSTVARDVLYKGATSLTLEVLDYHGSRPESDATLRKEPNTLLSPLALALSFALVLEGSVARTIDRVLETLRWQLLRDSDIRYVMAHALHRLSHFPSDSVRVEAAAFVQRDFDVTRTYRQSLDTYYGADVLLVNFLDRRAALVALNAWVCRVTSRVILRLLLDNTSEIDSASRFMAAGVLTLKLSFDQPFQNPRVQLPFTSELQSQSIEAMHTVGTFGYKQFADRGFDAVALPLLSGNLSLVVLVPAEGSTVTSVRKNLIANPDWLLNLQAEMEPRVVEVTLPRFKVTSVCGLKSALTALDYGHLFDRFQTNMAAVSRHGHAYVANIMNAVSLDVGPVTSTSPTVTEAAPTASPTVAFHVNRPFIYVVADKTDGLPLAIGQFVDPSSSAAEASNNL
ncbi:plasminogen activator inhibitor 1 [Rhipicephalus microplus]|uniref:plasminogen activator inhibitor 1 n=1 Tax=Rhipicephalus microplus TaxID=6941 RepID=UPI003F6C2A9E